MRKTLLLGLAAVALAAAPAATAQVLFDENFAYPTGTAIGGTGAVPTPPNPTTNWATHSGAPGQITVVSPGLAFSPSTPAYPMASGGAVQLLASQTEDVNRAFTPQTSGSIYVSALVRPDAVPSTPVGSYFLHLANNTAAGTSFRGRVWVGAGTFPNQVTFGVSTAGNTPVMGGDLPTGQTFLVVLRYDIGPGTSDDAARIYVFRVGSNISAEPATPWAQATDTGTDPANIGTLVLRQGTSTAPGGTIGGLTVDGIRVATSWAGVTTVAAEDEARPSGPGLAVWGRRVRVTTDTPAALDVALFDVLGRQVATLFLGTAAGVAEAMLPEGLVPGMYVVRASGAGLSSARTVVVQ